MAVACSRRNVVLRADRNSGRNSVVRRIPIIDQAIFGGLLHNPRDSWLKLAAETECDDGGYMRREELEKHTRD